MPSICIQSFISFYCRANIESSYGQQVTQLRIQYTPEDKELIKEFLEAKRHLSETLPQMHVTKDSKELEAGLFGKLFLSLSLTHTHILITEFTQMYHHWHSQST